MPLINHEELSEEQGNRIVSLLNDENEFAAPYGAPTISQASEAFNHQAYWSGPMWPWVNRYLFHGAKEAGESIIATMLRRSVIEAVSSHGAYEHYSPVTSEAGGAREFSPTAGTYIELDSVEVK